MEQEELKRKLLGLWEKTTHTSKDILSVLFDYYFDERYLEYKEHDGKIVSALCGIPYSFGFGKHRLYGLYIISLSSEEGYKKKGVLAELLQKLNSRVERDFDFTFLIPASELMADYYGTQGYFSSFFILEERFTPLHDFRNDYFLSLTDSEDRIKNLKIELLEKITILDSQDDNSFSKDLIIQFIENIERKGTTSINLNHTHNDLEFLLSYSNIRNIKWYLAYDSEGKITGVIFIQKEELKRIRVIATYVDDLCSYFALLDFIKRQNADHSISINTSDPKFQTLALIHQTYASENPSGGDLDNTFNEVEISFNFNKLLHPQGMVRLLRFDKIIEYIAATRSDVDFKLHIRDYIIDTGEEDVTAQSNREEDNKLVFNVKNGKLKIEKFDKIHNNGSILNLSKKEVSELLLRKNDSSNLIMEAFGIPRLNLQMQLIPYR